MSYAFAAMMLRYLGHAAALILSAASAVAIITLGSDAQMLVGGALLTLAVVIYALANFERA